MSTSNKNRMRILVRIVAANLAVMMVFSGFLGIVFEKLADMRIVDSLYHSQIAGRIVDKLALNQAQAAAGSYTEAFTTLNCGANAAWTDMDLSGSGVPANAVVEMAVLNILTTNEQIGGVRANGSSLTRSMDLREAEAGGTSIMVMHVQADASSIIECYAEVATTSITFRMLGYWECTGGGCYTERMDTLNAANAATWEDENLSGFGVSDGDVVEVLAENSLATAARYVGIRTDASSLERRVDLNEAEGGGDSIMTMHAVAETANATVEIYEEVIADSSLRLVGYWSDPPGTYTEVFSTIAAPASDLTWTDKDLSSAGVSDSGIAEVVVANGSNAVENEFGVRTNGSSVERRLDVMEAEDGGAISTDSNRQTGRFSTVVDSSGVLEIYHEDVSDTVYEFQLVGYWTPTAPASITLSGQIYSNAGVTPYQCSTVANLTVKVLVGGSGTSSGTCTADTGVFSVSVTGVSANSILTVLLDGETPNAATITKAADGTSAIDSVYLYQDHVIIRNETTGSITNANLSTADGDADDSIYDVSSNNLTVNSNVNLLVWSGDTYDPGGTVTTQGTGDFTVSTSSVAYLDTTGNTIAGDIHVDVNGGTGGTLYIDADTTVNGGAISATGTANLLYSGGTTPTVTLSGTGTVADNGSATSTFYNFTTSGSGT